MTLYEKIIAIYPSLELSDFIGPASTILLQNDNNQKGDYIKEWNHPTLARPTEQELA
jgi:hypothetical protein